VQNRQRELFIYKKILLQSKKISQHNQKEKCDKCLKVGKTATKKASNS